MDTFYNSDFVGYLSSDRDKVQNFITDVALSEHHERCEIVQDDKERRKELEKFFLKKAILFKYEKDLRAIKRECDSWSLILDHHKIDCSLIPSFSRLQGLTYDLKIFDDAQDISDCLGYSLLWWKREVQKDKNIAQKVLFTIDPLKINKSDWVYKFFEPWFSGKVSYGEEAIIAQEENGDIILLDRKDPFIYKNGVKIYDFDPENIGDCTIIHPETRILIME